MPGPSLTSVAESKLNALNKNIVEIKKKIQLSEGQRKANFEKCEAAKRENAERIARLKREAKDLYVEYAKAKNNDEAAERASQASRESSARVKRRNLEDTVATYSEELVRLRKKYDLIKYQCNKEQQSLHLLLVEREELKKGKTQKMFKKKMETPLKKKIISLEIQLEHTRMTHMKANAVRKKYKSVRCGLKKKAVAYASCLKELEDSIKDQENEINRLKGVKEEAVELRDDTQETLAKQEIDESNSSKQREYVIQDFRRRVADRRSELERLERMIFPSRPRDDFDAREGKYSAQEGTDSTSKDEVTLLEEAFAKLRNATGVSRSEDVLDRFLDQRATRESVQKMRAAAEQEKTLLEKRRQELTAEIETQKFSETKNAERNAEAVDELNAKIAEQRARRERTIAETKRIRETLDKITETLRELCVALGDDKDADKTDEASEAVDPLRIVAMLEVRVKSTMDVLGGRDELLDASSSAPTDKIETLSVATTSAEGKATRFGGPALFPRFPSSSVPAAVPSEEEDEVPTRNALKRQAQLLVDTKTRRKGFAFKR